MACSDASLKIMNNPHLQPEQRADRNGNVVTRWVKRSIDSISGSTKVPAPFISKDYEVQKSLESTMNEMLAAKRDLYESMLELEEMREFMHCADVFNEDSNGEGQPVSDGGLEAYRSFRDLAASLGVGSRGKISPALEKAAGHIAIYPGDAPILESMLRRGIKDSDTALNLLAESKKEAIPDSLNDGFL